MLCEPYDRANGSWNEKKPIRIAAAYFSIRMAKNVARPSPKDCRCTMKDDKHGRKLKFRLRFGLEDNIHHNLNGLSSTKNQCIPHISHRPNSATVCGLDKIPNFLCSTRSDRESTRGDPATYAGGALALKGQPGVNGATVTHHVQVALPEIDDPLAPLVFDVSIFNVPLERNRPIKNLGPAMNFPNIKGMCF